MGLTLVDLDIRFLGSLTPQGEISALREGVRHRIQREIRPFEGSNHLHLT